MNEGNKNALRQIRDRIILCKIGRFLHSSPVPTYYQWGIPFLIWFSEEYQTDIQDRLLQL